MTQIATSSKAGRAERIDYVAGHLLPHAALLTRLLVKEVRGDLSRTEGGVLNTLSGASRRITELAELEGLAAGLARAYPASNQGWGVTLVPLKEQVIGEVRPSLLVLLGAVGFILLIACVNITNLLLARSTRRSSSRLPGM